MQRSALDPSISTSRLSSARSPRSPRSARARRQTAPFSLAPSHSPSGCFVTSESIRRADAGVLGELDAVEHQHE